MVEKIPMTAAGYTTLEAELKHCQSVERPRIIQPSVHCRSVASILGHCAEVPGAVVRGIVRDA